MNSFETLNRNNLFEIQGGAVPLVVPIMLIAAGSFGTGLFGGLLVAKHDYEIGAIIKDVTDNAN